MTLYSTVSWSSYAPRLETPAHESHGSYGLLVADWARQHLDVEMMPWQVHCLVGQLVHDENGDLLKDWKDG